MNVSAKRNARSLRISVSKMLEKLFDHWNLSQQERCDLLGLPVKARSRRVTPAGGFMIGTTRDAQDRAGHLLAVHSYLRQLFPHDQCLAYSWMKTSNQAFEGKTPVELIKSFGFAGLLMVRAYLERSMHR